MYDAIVVGARCAGSPTAMLLARKGYRVLLVDKARFPSDTMSGHFIHTSGVVRLQRWGLLDRLEAAGCPPVQTWRIDLGPIVLNGGPVAQDGIATMYGPRRTTLDAMLIEAAVEAGAEFREAFTVREIIEEAGVVTGIRGRTNGGATITEHARIVIGADGRHSLVARAVQAASYHARPPVTCAYYSYWEGLNPEGLEIYPRDGSMTLAFPTMDGLSLVYATWPAARFKEIRSDIEGHFMEAIDRVPEFAERVRAATRAERFTGTGDLPNFFHVPHGPGWALVGDAGYHKDPYLAQGISDAFRDAELVADAVDAGLSGRASLDVALATYQAQRDAAALPAYEFNLQRASLTPPAPEMAQFLAATSRSEAETSRFIGAMVGTVPYQEVFAPENIARVVGNGLIAA